VHWAYPEWIWLSVLAGVVGLMAAVVLARKRHMLRRLALVQPWLLVSRWKQVAKTALLVVAVLLLGVAILGPQWGHADEETQPASGRDVLIVLDVSRSMLAEDVQPSRLARAKADVRDLAKALEQRGGYRIGLLAFADRAVVLCPLTFDYRAFEEELEQLSLERLRLRGDPGSEDGTQIGAALRRAAQAIDKEGAAYTDIVLISDGDDMADDTLAAADELAKTGIPVHAIGVGDPSKGSPIPVIGPEGSRTFLKYQGEQVRTKLEEQVLREVAKRTGGRYVAAGTGFLNMDHLFGPILADKPARELHTAGTNRVWLHRFQWFLAPAIALLLLEMLLRDGRKAARGGTGRSSYWGWVRRKREPTHH
jgi:Ca-activated chloride channel family protein